MPAVSPAKDIDDLSLRLTVKVNGSAISDKIGISLVNVTHEINKISYAEVVLTGENAVETADLTATDSNDFAPGNEVKITAGYGDKGEKDIFEGVIVKHGIEMNSSSLFDIKITCKHKVVSMTFTKKEEEFKDKTDSAVINEIFKAYGFTCSTDSTAVTNENFYQKSATDWDIVLSRAELNGFIITLDGTAINIKKPVVNSNPVLRVSAGETIMAFDAELNAERQAVAVEASAWDLKTQALIKAAASEPGMNEQGNLSASALSAKLQQTTVKLHTATPMSADELKVWADGFLLRMRLNACKGKVTFIGNADIKTGDLLTLEGVGKKFNGDAFVTSVNHVLELGLWKTTAKFGLDNKFIYEKQNFSSAPAAGQLPAIQGLQIGTVKKLSEDPQSQYRILINLPSAAVNENGVWARVSNFYATSDAGLGFYPEVGDEVVAGFFESDPRYPVVLGSLYNPKNKTPNEAVDENNYIKSLTTKSKLKISFDDEKKVIKIETPAGNIITMSEEDKAVEIKDQNSNSFKMSSDGIALESPKDIKIDSKATITLNAAGKLTLSSKQDVTIEGLNIKNTANVGFEAKGNATAEISASGQTTVKGGIVMIN